MNIPYWMAESLITKADNGNWRWYYRVRQGTWETRMAAGFAPGWSQTGCLCGKYRDALRRHRISK